MRRSGRLASSAKSLASIDSTRQPLRALMGSSKEAPRCRNRSRRSSRHTGPHCLRNGLVDGPSLHRQAPHFALLTLAHQDHPSYAPYTPSTGFTPPSSHDSGSISTTWVHLMRGWELRLDFASAARRWRPASTTSLSARSTQTSASNAGARSTRQTSRWTRSSLLASSDLCFVLFWLLTASPSCMHLSLSQLL
jgi:hypothetical protein